MKLRTSIFTVTVACISACALGQTPQPFEIKPIEIKPTETQPTETQPTETQPAETQPVEALPPEPVFVPTSAEVFGPFETWLAQRNPSEELQKTLEPIRQSINDQLSTPDRLELLISMIRIADDRFALYLEPETLSGRLYPVDDLLKLLGDAQTPEWLSVNMRLFVAVNRVHKGCFDDASKLLDGLTVETTACPATLLLYQGITAYQRLDKTTTVSLIRRLQTIENQPVRYRELSNRMLRDIERLDAESLDHISRRMSDVAGRLDSGRANQKVQDIEDGIIKSLDKKIKELEDKMQQSQSSSQSNNLQPQSPGLHKQLPTGKAPGRVARKDFKPGAEWGALPDAEREADLQQIQENFPPHYRDIIEQYFRRMAE